MKEQLIVKFSPISTTYSDCKGDIWQRKTDLGMEGVFWLLACKKNEI